MGEILMSISIPTDDEGFVLLRCPKCGEFFKLPPSDIESDEVLEIHCPQCGLVSESYFTEDVIKLAEAKVLNNYLEGFYDSMKKLDRETRNSMFKVKVNKPEKKEENLIKSTINEMEIVDFECCNRQAKVRYILDYCGCYCPYCGGQKDGNN